MDSSFSIRKFVVSDPTVKDGIGTVKLTPREQMEEMMKEVVEQYQQRFALSMREMREMLIQDLKDI